MKRLTRYSLYVFILLQINFPLSGQTENGVTSEKVTGLQISEYVLPSSLLILGIFISNSQCEINLNSEIRNITGENFESDIDDYLQYAPIAELFIADILGVEAKNHWFDQTKNLAIANLATSIVTRALKVTTGKLRPTGAPYSFPSGHTSFAFCNATVLYKEFEQSNRLVAYSGFAFSTTTGMFRIINNRHWLSDVLFGAGTGILVSQIVYYFDPIIAWNPFKNSDNISLIPVIDDNYYSLYFSYKF